MKLAVKLFIFLVILVIAFVAVTVWKAGANEARAESNYPPEGQLLDIDGVQVHAVVRGEGPDLVLIHGSSGSTRDFTFALVERLAPDFRVIVFDRPGLGYTGTIEDPTIERQADLLGKAAAQLGAPKPIVLGQSYGGSVALAWAVNHPDDLSALVTLASPALPWTTGLSTFYKTLSNPILGPITAPLITAWVSRDRVTQGVESVFAPQSAPKGYGDYFGPGLTLRRASLRANAIQRARLLNEIKSLSLRYEAISVPMEIVHGDADTTVGLHIHSRPLAARLDQANLTVLEGVGHMPHHVAEDDIIAAIKRASHRAALH
ncbi:acetoin dehydrogenase E2 subunit dihydrolipoyllysine-residue acetyltransferase [Cognatishimia activa]|uniref:Acetoin dehydrogenase E2 subunit dihydrolipoyllysine-residue acetyltransferase n=1 Tax=Cognatishimia activa TaxID=1715691 RepID=A0A0P1INY5_9RHOB|nr:alpha/beta hydrolase [Cognatishimia activa]CUK25365.1 acetoin dehydrogenase E2 subunit dihydrolipoyllysine-residue acetyltransferase [Cognatishimia activa]